MLVDVSITSFEMAANIFIFLGGVSMILYGYPVGIMEI